MVIEAQLILSVSLSSSEPGSPEPISAEDMLENQENIAIDQSLFEIGDDEDIDMFAGMPHLQDISDSEDENEGKFLFVYLSELR